VDVDAADVGGTWWRHIPAHQDVHHRPEDAADNRWQRGHVVDALYFADSEATAWAEWYRYLAEAALPPQQGLPRDLWRWEVSLPKVADLRTAPALERVGLSVPVPRSSDWPPFQAVGEGLYRDGWPALVAPSAARPQEGRVLCVFREAREAPGVRPLPPPETYKTPPAVPKGLTT
jgi:RES domain-containing protein